MITIGKEFYFESAHWIDGHQTCGRPHGHTWKLTVEITGDIAPDSGMLMDFKELGKLVRSITDVLDHKTINDVVDLRPLTAETLVQWFAQKIHMSLSFCPMTLTCTLQEGTNGGWARYSL